MKDPAMLFYTSDFLTGVTLLNMKERGQYITLLCLQQQLGHMTLKQMTTAVGKLSEAVMDKFIQDDDGLYYNRRADIEINKRKAHSQKQRENVQKRWNKDTESIPKDVPKKYDGINHGITTVIPLENENENRNENINLKSITQVEDKIKRFKPPTVDEVRAYCTERGNSVDPQSFVDFYTSNGWKVGKNPMKDWKAAVRTWETRDKSDQQRGRVQTPSSVRAPSNHQHSKESIDKFKKLVERMEI